MKKPFFWWTDEQKAFQKEIREFVETLVSYEETTRWTREHPFKIYEEFQKHNYVGAAVPKEYGGLGLGVTGSCILAEEIHSRMPGIGRYIVGNMNGGLMQIVESATEEQKKKYLPGICKCEMGAVVITETTAGTDAAGISVQAVYDEKEDCYILNGKKRFIVGAGVADRYFVYARTSNDPEVIKKHKHLTAFILYKGTPGFSCEKVNDILAFQNVQNGSLDFNNVKIPASDRIGGEGDGWKMMMNGLNFERTNIAASTIGWQRLMLETAYPYCERRVQFGKPVLDIAANQEKLASMVMRLKTTRPALYYTAYQWDHDEDITIEASTMKAYGAELTLESAKEATQVMGGDGINRFYPVQNLFEVAKTEHMAGGTVEACRLTIFRGIAKHMSEDVKMVRRVQDPKLGVPVPTFEPVEKKMPATAENILKVLADDYVVNPALHMTKEDLAWYIEDTDENVEKAIAELIASGDAWALPDKKKGGTKLVRASYAGLKKAYPQEHYEFFPPYIKEDPRRTF